MVIFTAPMNQFIKQKSSDKNTPTSATQGDFTELDITASQGQRLFLQSTEDVYKQILQFQPIAIAEQYRRLSFADVRGEEIFTVAKEIQNNIRRKINYWQAQVSAQSFTPSNQEIAMLQGWYDDLLAFRNLLKVTYVHIEKNSSVKSAESVPTKQNEARPEQKTKNIAGASRFESKKQQNNQNYSPLERLIETAEKRITVVQTRVLNRIPPAERHEKIAVGIEELNRCSNRLTDLKKRILLAKKETIPPTVWKETVADYKNLIDTVVRKVDQLETSLVQHKEESTLTVQMMSVKNSAATTPQITTAPLVTDGGVLNKQSQESIPSEAAIISLAKQIYEDQFYSRAERAKVQNLCESIHRTVAMGGSSTQCHAQYQILKNYITDLQEAPAIADLKERATRIMQRVMVGTTYDSEVLHTVRRLEHEFRVIAEDPKQSEVQVRVAYKALESYARKTEKEWLTLCGLLVPAAGTQGLSAARTLRETLLVERDRHRALVRDPKKQILVDKLIRKLSTLSPAGLSTEVDIPEILALFRAIDVPEQQGELHRSHRSEEVVLVEPENDVLQTSVAPVHKVMEVMGDGEEKILEIQVANNANQRIFSQTETPTQISPEPAVVKAQEEAVHPQQNDLELIATLEKNDPVSNVKPLFAPALQKPSPILAEDSLTNRYLNEEVYQTFINRRYTSPVAFERILDATIQHIEAQTIDALERWLGEERPLAFSFLEDMTVAEVQRLAGHPEVRALLAKENIKYETFLQWVDLLPEMQSMVTAPSDELFGSLYAKWMIETEMALEAEESAA